MISIKENVNSIEEFNYLYDAVGWGSYDEKVSEKALANTMYSVSVYDDDKIIEFMAEKCKEAGINKKLF